MNGYLIGDIIEDKYRIVKPLGEGGMNRVYLVEGIDGSGQYAMKVTREPGELNSSNQEIYNQFLKEVSILSTIKHKSLPVIHDYFSSGNKYYILEEYIDGESLDKFIQGSDPDEEFIVTWALKLCDVLEVLHKKRIIFRDLKPANIMIANDGNLKLIDFDIARFYKEGKNCDTSLLGTPGYAAPETYGRTQSDARSDIYSLGATMYHLYTKRDPQDNPFCFFPILSLKPNANVKLVKIIDKALSHKPQERYKSVAEMKKELLDVNNDLISKKNAASVAIQNVQMTPNSIPFSSFPLIFKIAWIMLMLLFLFLFFYGISK